MNRFLVSLMMLSAVVFVAGLWIPLKAVVAQELLTLAWAEAESQARQTDWQFFEVTGTRVVDSRDEEVSGAVVTAAGRFLPGSLDARHKTGQSSPGL